MWTLFIGAISLDRISVFQPECYIILYCTGHQKSYPDAFVCTAPYSSTRYHGEWR